MRIAIALGSFQGPRIVSLCAKIYIWGDSQVFALVALCDYRITSRVQIEGREKLQQAQLKAVCWPKTSLPLYRDGRHGGLGCPTNLRQSLMRSTIQQLNVLGLVHPSQVPNAA